MRLTCLALVGLSILGCSSGADPDDGAASGSGGGAGETSGAGGTFDAPPNPKHGGIVEVLTGTLQGDTGPVAVSMAMAFFWDAPGATGGSCTDTTHGACRVTTCITGTPVEATTISAGTITIEANESLSLVPDATNDYEMVTATGLLWDPGDAVTVSAAGGMVPAFTHTRKSSSPVTITSPPAPAMGGVLALDRAHDQVWTWTGGSTGVVTIMWKSDATDPFTTIRCKFPTDDGTGTVPAAALQALAANGTGDVLVIGGDIDGIEVGDYTIQVIVDTIPTWGAEGGVAHFAAEN